MVRVLSTRPFLLPAQVLEVDMEAKRVVVQASNMGVCAARPSVRKLVIEWTAPAVRRLSVPSINGPSPPGSLTGPPAAASHQYVESVRSRLLESREIGLLDVLQHRVAQAACLSKRKPPGAPASADHGRHSG
jgi:hypothetical protein